MQERGTDTAVTLAATIEANNFMFSLLSETCLGNENKVYVTVLATFSCANRKKVQIEVNRSRLKM